MIDTLLSFLPLLAQASEPTLWEQVQSYLPQFLDIRVLLEVVALYVLIYYFIRFTEGTRGAGILKGLAVMILISVLGMGAPIGGSSGALSQDRRRRPGGWRSET